MISGETPLEERNRAGDQEGIRDEGLRPEGGFDTLWRVENEKGLRAEVNLADLRIRMKQGLTKTESSNVV